MEGARYNTKLLLVVKIHFNLSSLGASLISMDFFL